MAEDPNTVVELNAAQTSLLVETRVTCPFVGSAVATGKLSVRNSADDPLASIEDIRELGDSGGGDLGEVLALFAAGNHAFMRSDDGKLSKPAPSGLFSLEFAGSQGAHAGDSGILVGDPQTPASGRLSMVDFARLTGRAKLGVVKRSDVGRFIAENLFRDSRAKVIGLNVVGEIGADIVNLGAALVSDLLARLAGSGSETTAETRELEQRFAKLLGEDNLTGSAGEFGLLFAFVAHKPDAIELDGEPTVSVEDLDSMFVKKRLPDGFETWRKLRRDWLKNSAALAIAAASEYRDLLQDRPSA